MTSEGKAYRAVLYRNQSSGARLPRHRLLSRDVLGRPGRSSMLGPKPCHETGSQASFNAGRKAEVAPGSEAGTREHETGRTLLACAVGDVREEGPAHTPAATYSTRQLACTTRLAPAGWQDSLAAVDPRLSFYVGQRLPRADAVTLLVILSGW